MINDMSKNLGRIIWLTVIFFMIGSGCGCLFTKKPPPQKEEVSLSLKIPRKSIKRRIPYTVYFKNNTSDSMMVDVSLHISGPRGSNAPVDISVKIKEDLIVAPRTASSVKTIYHHFWDNFPGKYSYEAIANYETIEKGEAGEGEKRTRIYRMFGNFQSTAKIMNPLPDVTNPTELNFNFNVINHTVNRGYVKYQIFIDEGDVAGEGLIYKDADVRTDSVEALTDKDINVESISFSPQLTKGSTYSVRIMGVMESTPSDGDPIDRCELLTNFTVK